MTVETGTSRLRNYTAMGDEKLLRVIAELQTGRGDAREKEGHRWPAALSRAIAAAEDRGLHVARDAGGDAGGDADAAAPAEVDADALAVALAESLDRVFADEPEAESDRARHAAAPAREFPMIPVGALTLDDMDPTDIAIRIEDEGPLPVTVHPRFSAGMSPDTEPGMDPWDTHLVGLEYFQAEWRGILDEEARGPRGTPSGALRRITLDGVVLREEKS